MLSRQKGGNPMNTSTYLWWGNNFIRYNKNSKMCKKDTQIRTYITFIHAKINIFNMSNPWLTNQYCWFIYARSAFLKGIFFISTFTFRIISFQHITPQWRINDLLKFELNMGTWNKLDCLVMHECTSETYSYC